MRFKDYMIEGINIKDGQVHFNYTNVSWIKKMSLKELLKYKEQHNGLSKNTEMAINIEIGKKKRTYKDDTEIDLYFGKSKFEPYKTSTENVNVFSVYSSKGNTNILKAIKHLGDNNVDVKTSEYLQFIKRTSIYISSKILKNKNIDYIVTPQSSSNILNDVLDDVSKMNPHIKILRENFKKIVDIDKIKILKDHPKITPKIIKMLEKVISNAKSDGYFQIKNIKAVQFRKFVTGYMELIDSYKYEKLKNKNILLLDDVYSSGTTIAEMINKLKMYEPNNIIGITLFKNAN